MRPPLLLCRRRGWGRSVIRAILRRFGFVKIDHGAACGRHWVSIDGKMIYQATGADLWMPDDFTQALAIVADPACEWELPFRWKALNEGRDL